MTTDTEPTVEERLDSTEARLAVLECDRWDKAEFETRKHDFIRAAVLVLIAQGPLPESPRTLWELARALWDVKPEDC